MSGVSAKRSTTAAATRRGGTTRRPAKSNRVSPSGSPPIWTRTTIPPSVASSRSSRSVHARRTPTWRSSPRRSAIGAPPTCCNERCRAAARSAGSATRCTTSRTFSRTGRRTPAPVQRRGRSSGSPPSAMSTKPMPTQSWRRGGHTRRGLGRRRPTTRPTRRGRLDRGPVARGRADTRRRSGRHPAAGRTAVGDDQPGLTQSPSAARSRSGFMAPMASSAGTGKEASRRVSSSRPIGSSAASRGVRPPRAGIDSSSHRRSMPTM